MGIVFLGDSEMLDVSSISGPELPNYITNFDSELFVHLVFIFVVDSRVFVFNARLTNNYV